MKFKCAFYSCLSPILPSNSKNPFKIRRILPLLCIVLYASVGMSDEVSYIYDDTGQLIRAVKQTEAVSYQYDANGNLIAVGGGAASEGANIGSGLFSSHQPLDGLGIITARPLRIEYSGAVDDVTNQGDRRASRIACQLDPSNHPVESRNAKKKDLIALL